jgi:hypothetical protein
LCDTHDDMQAGRAKGLLLDPEAAVEIAVPIDLVLDPLLALGRPFRRPPC